MKVQCVWRYLCRKSAERGTHTFARPCCWNFFLDVLVWRLCYKTGVFSSPLSLLASHLLLLVTAGPGGAIFTHRWKWSTCRGIEGLCMLVNMLKTRQCLLGIRTFLSVTSRIWGFIMYILRKHLRTVRNARLSSFVCILCGMFSSLSLHMALPKLMYVLHLFFSCR